MLSVASTAATTARCARTRLLAAGIDLLRQTGVNTGVGHIKVAAVCEHAGYTTGAAYRVWPTQSDYHRDLAAAAIMWSVRRPTDSRQQARTRSTPDATPMLEVLRRGGASSIRRQISDVDARLALALAASTTEDPTLNAARTAWVQEGITTREHVLRRCLLRFGRRMREPFTTTHLATAIAALVEGFTLQQLAGHEHPQVDRPGLGPDVGRDWTLLGSVLHLLIDAFTEPDQSRDSVEPR